MREVSGGRGVAVGTKSCQKTVCGVVSASRCMHKVPFHDGFFVQISTENRRLS